MIFLAISVVTVFASALPAVPSAKKSKVRAPTGAMIQSSKMIHLDNMAMWVQNDGLFASNPETGQSGLYSPVSNNKS